jgi:hypothetical protein
MELGGLFTFVILDGFWTKKGANQDESSAEDPTCAKRMFSCFIPTVTFASIQSGFSSVISVPPVLGENVAAVRSLHFYRTERGYP